MKYGILAVLSTLVLLVLQVVFIYLGVTGIVNWSWAVIAIPSFVFLGILAALLLVGIGVGLICLILVHTEN